jgi:hypothetical protein
VGRLILISSVSRLVSEVSSANLTFFCGDSPLARFAESEGFAVRVTRGPSWVLFPVYLPTVDK